MIKPHSKRFAIFKTIFYNDFNNIKATEQKDFPVHMK